MPRAVYDILGRDLRYRTSLPSNSIMVSVQYLAAVSPLPKIPSSGKRPAGSNAVTDKGTNSKTLQKSRTPLAEERQCPLYDCLVDPSRANATGRCACARQIAFTQPSPQGNGQPTRTCKLWLLTSQEDPITICLHFQDLFCSSPTMFHEKADNNN